ncbi:GNAT family N-acetyltransferase [Micromonospora sp. SL4-19]|uniref:GNAT family N-acetyltransferase n=1 Tax=Micromonospora sp. SL4-19 TaxID=3399129 RepID=UPI003A4DFC80
MTTGTINAAAAGTWQLGDRTVNRIGFGNFRAAPPPAVTEEVVEAATRPPGRTPGGGRSVSTIAAQTITTRRLDLLPLLVEHAEEMVTVLSDPALHTFTGGTPDTQQALRSRYQRMTAGCPDPAVSWLNWVIRLRDEDCLTGTVQATINPSGHGPIAEIAWVVGTPWQGRGIATEAAHGLVDWLSQQPIPTIIAHIHPGHQASAAVAAAAGLSASDEWHEGEIRWRRSLRR